MAHKLGVNEHRRKRIFYEKKKNISNLHEISTTIQSLLKIRNNVASEKLKDGIKKTIHTLLSPDLWGQKHTVSEKAQKFADKMKYKKNLSSCSWDDLGHECFIDKTKQKHNGKRGLILEHIILRSDIIDLLFNCDLDDIKNIKEIVKQTKCAVIHWREDDKLKPRNKRSDPINAYDEVAKIKLIKYKNMSEFIGKEGSKWIDEKINFLPKYKKEAARTRMGDSH
jgi:hypothetical protein